VTLYLKSLVAVSSVAVTLPIPVVAFGGVSSAPLSVVLKCNVAALAALAAKRATPAAKPINPERMFPFS
jgi:thiamine monophosphate synthase